jgi:hypothetical protein
MNIITYIPDLINATLFEGTNLFVAQMLLCAVIILATVIPLLYFKASMHQILVIEIVMVLILTGMGWMDVSILVVLLLLIALGFGKTVVSGMLGDGK